MYKEKEKLNDQWRIQDFPGDGTPTPKFGQKTYYLARLVSKTAKK